jgi:hypothetical protein
MLGTTGGWRKRDSRTEPVAARQMMLELPAMVEVGMVEVGMVEVGMVEVGMVLARCDHR